MLQIYAFEADGSGYKQVERSALLPNLPLDIFCRYATYHDQFDAVDEFLREIG